MNAIVTNNADISVTKIAETQRKPRGFAAMNRDKVKEIASKGGKAAHAAGTAHQFTAEEARTAGQKGGVAPHKSRGRAIAKSTDESKAA